MPCALSTSGRILLAGGGGGPLSFSHLWQGKPLTELASQSQSQPSATFRVAEGSPSLLVAARWRQRTAAAEARIHRRSLSSQPNIGLGLRLLGEQKNPFYHPGKKKPSYIQLLRDTKAIAGCFRKRRWSRFSHNVLQKGGVAAILTSTSIRWHTCSIGWREDEATQGCFVFPPPNRAVVQPDGRGGENSRLEVGAAGDALL